MNRGSSPVPGPHMGSVAGFNEAPIHESGKSPNVGPRYGWRACFNEAPIHESGKYRAPMPHLTRGFGLQ